MPLAWRGLQGSKEERTACIDRIRGLLAEFGLVFPQSPKALRQVLPAVLEDASNEMGGVARLALQRAQKQWEELDAHMSWCDERVDAHVKNNEQTKAAAKLHDIGPIGASAVVTSVGDFKQFKSGAQFGAWLSIVPKQNSSGGKTVLGRITKRGDEYLRTLLIQGAKSAVTAAHKRSDPISKWVVQLKDRVGWHGQVNRESSTRRWTWSMHWSRRKRRARRDASRSACSAWTS